MFVAKVLKLAKTKMAAIPNYEILNLLEYIFPLIRHIGTEHACILLMSGDGMQYLT